jgi:sec-independent protein translocase protein TatB
MFGIGMPELMVILVVALVVLGPKRLPEVARTIGKAVSEFRRQSSEIMDEFTSQGTFDDEGLKRTRPRPSQAIARPTPTPPTDGAPVASTATADKPGPDGQA